MKKILTSLFVFLCVLSAVCAAQNTVSASIIPVGTQFTISSDRNAGTIVSFPGLGIEASYGYAIDKELIGIDGIYAEGGLGFSMYGKKIASGERKWIKNLNVFVGAGYSYDINETIAVFGHLDFLEDTLFYNGKVSASFGFKVGGGASYRFNEKIGFMATIDGSFTFSKGANASYADIRIVPSAGASYSF